MKFLRVYLLGPFKLLLQNMQLLLILTLVIGLEKIVRLGENFLQYYNLSLEDVSFSGDFLYGKMNNVFGIIYQKIISAPMEFVVILLVSFLLLCLGIWLAQSIYLQMSASFRGERISLLSKSAYLPWSDFWWYGSRWFVFHLLLLAFAIGLYATVAWIWLIWKIDLTWVILLVIAVLYPLYYTLISVPLFIATPPIPREERAGLMKAMERKWWPFYKYYFLRILIDESLRYGPPILVWSFTHSLTWLLIAAVPHVFLSVLAVNAYSYAVRLKVFNDQLAVREAYKVYFEKISKA